MRYTYSNQYVLHDDFAECFIIRQDEKILGKFIIDIEDVEKCKKKTWNFDQKGYIRNSSMGIHRYVLSYFGPLQIDHINRDKTDNRKSNLRIVDGFTNNQNNASDGVSFDLHAQKWKAEFHRYGKYFYAGIHETKEEAIVARNKLIEELDNNKESLLSEFYSKDKEHCTGIRPSPHGKWVAKFCTDNKVYHVGTFDSKEEAIKKREEFILKYEQSKQPA